MNTNNPEKQLDAEFRFVDGFILDTISENRLGGTGETHDWSISRELVSKINKRGLAARLAGGFNPDNLAEAIIKVQPDLVDVNSGVENMNGDKDAGKVNKFVEIAHSFR